MNKLRSMFNGVDKDKYIHFSVGVIISAVLSIFINVFIVAIISLCIAWCIEIYQLLTNTGKYDNRDAIAVIIGAYLVLLPQLVQRIA